jgi:protein-disulfide isomerase
MSTKNKNKSKDFVVQNQGTSLNIFLVPASIVLAGLLIMVSILVSATSVERNMKDYVDNSLANLNTSNNNLANAGAQEQPEPEPVYTKVSIDDDPIKGNPAQATVAIVEFSDYECPFCKRYYEEAYQDIVKNYVDTDKAFIVFRDNPLSFHDPLATQQAIAGECVQDLGGDDKYYEYHDLIFETTESNIGMEKSELYTLAAKVGVDKKKFSSCFDKEKFKEEVEKDMADAAEAGLSGTPGFVVGTVDENGIVDGKVVSGAQPYSVFKATIEEYLAN